MYQTYNMYMSYSVHKEKVEVHSFYRRVFELIKSNDFEEAKTSLMEEDKSSFIAQAIVELCRKKSYKHESKVIFSQDKKPSLININQDFFKKTKLKPYQYLFTLDQNYPIEYQ